MTLAAAAGVVGTAALGLWQVNRAHGKRALQQEHAQRERAPAIDGAQLVARPNGDWHRQPVRLRGRWRPEAQFWLDNRAHDRRAGTILVTPLALEGGGVLWVQRGWQVRQPGQHGVPPWPISPPGVVQVEGYLARQASQAYDLGGPRTGPLRQNLDLGVASREMGLPVLPWVAWQTGPGCAPLQCNWPPPEDGIHKHWGYAVQWFALSALILGLYVWFQHLQPHRAGARSGSTDGSRIERS
ncbi:SURF1 family protein [Inhella sp. 4Y17]|uniref:SURF1-like protein n=1 Tax=Inhella gelatinilytica TaxID=2795030 RepID=A0A931IX90_9BURK|nr:SURF1 family protein [Inhella gelatinilytica]